MFKQKKKFLIQNQESVKSANSNMKIKQKVTKDEKNAKLMYYRNSKMDPCKMIRKSFSQMFS